MDFVILPLYSTQSGSKIEVAPKSGINQWNAAGRVRTFGEAYIPVPGQVRRARGEFFPPKDHPFNLQLPNGIIVKAKICQQGGKALMSNPNDALCRWLFSTIDGNWGKATSRFAEKRPYSYADLVAVSMDSVRVLRDDVNDDYFLEAAPLGAYARFIAHQR